MVINRPYLETFAVRFFMKNRLDNMRLKTSFSLKAQFIYIILLLVKNKNMSFSLIIILIFEALKKIQTICQDLFQRLDLKF